MAPKAKSKDWLGKAEKKMEKKGTEGKFSAKAEKAGMTTLAYANKVIKELKGKTHTATQKKLLAQAVFAKNAIKASPK